MKLLFNDFSDERLSSNEKKTAELCHGKRGSHIGMGWKLFYGNSYFMREFFFEYINVKKKEKKWVRRGDVKRKRNKKRDLIFMEKNGMGR